MCAGEPGPPGAPGLAGLDGLNGEEGAAGEAGQPGSDAQYCACPPRDGSTLGRAFSFVQVGLCARVLLPP